ncbi:mucin-2-like [Alosa alosa]|uniref:mucin-2-like n=1 Tax=Alosa alosa TaxID=278164 RepID=UPI0020153062|nr:mucin-2-like [Alosa alosa]
MGEQCHFRVNAFIVMESYIFTHSRVMFQNEQIRELHQTVLALSGLSIQVQMAPEIQVYVSLPKEQNGTTTEIFADEHCDQLRDPHGIFSFCHSHVPYDHYYQVHTIMFHTTAIIRPASVKHATATVFCDYYNREGQSSWHYDPCGKVPTCGRNYNFNVKLEGCYPRCPAEAPYYENTRNCTTQKNCTCLFNGIVLRHGTQVSTPSGHCTWTDGTMDYEPDPTTTPPTTPTTTTTTEPPTTTETTISTTEPPTTTETTTTATEPPATTQITISTTEPSTTTTEPPTTTETTTTTTEPPTTTKTTISTTEPLTTTETTTTSTEPPTPTTISIRTLTTEPPTTTGTTISTTEPPTTTETVEPSTATTIFFCNSHFFIFKHSAK